MREMTQFVMVKVQGNPFLENDLEFDIVCRECLHSQCAEVELFSFCPYCGREVEKK